MLLVITGCTGISYKWLRLQSLVETQYYDMKLDVLIQSKTFITGERPNLTSMTKSYITFNTF